MPTGYNLYFYLLAVGYFWTSGSPQHTPAVVEPVICQYLITGGGLSIHLKLLHIFEVIKSVKDISSVMIYMYN